MLATTTAQLIPEADKSCAKWLLTARSVVKHNCE